MRSTHQSHYVSLPPPPRSVRSTRQSHSDSIPLRHGQSDQLTNHILSVSPSVTVSAINSPITFCQSPPPSRSERSTDQSHSVSLPLRHGQCDQLTNHILPVSPSVTVSAINSPITFCQSPPPSRSVRSTHQSHSASLPLRHGQCDQLTNHIPIVSPSVTVSAINSPILYCQSPPPSRSVRSTHQSHSISLPLPSRSVRLTHQSHYVSLLPPSRSVRSTHQSHYVSLLPPSRSVRSTHQSHYVSLPPPPRSVRTNVAFENELL